MLNESHFINEFSDGVDGSRLLGTGKLRIPLNGQVIEGS